MRALKKSSIDKCHVLVLITNIDEYLSRASNSEFSSYTSSADMRHLESIILFLALVFIWVPFIFFFLHSIGIKIWKFVQIYCSLPPSLTVPSFHSPHVKNMMINSVNDQGIEGSSSCDGCDCPQIIRLNPDKDSNTTVVTSPRNFLSWWGW